QALRIGELLCLLAEKQVQVRILGWEAPFNTAGVVGEANLPEKGILNLEDRVGQSATDKQYAFDLDWFARHSYSDDL
ncbi:phospholipase, partial [Klebsiella pneumoniae]|nr:phospholipase [Klebsiella pneumoniae]